MSAQKETLSFQAESRELLDMMIHSIYSNKEIFLRELISNASDALDKLRLEAISNPHLLPAGEELTIRLETDKEKRTLTIRDNGIGMNRDDLVRNIGTIARSGTREYLQKLKEKSDKTPADLIGQFGVGFYSAFMVADKVSILTRKADEDTAWHWESDGKGEYTLTDSERPGQGTTIVLTLKPADPENGIEDYSDPEVLKEVVKKHSDFIGYPISLKVESGDEVINSQKPIWVRPQSEVTAEEYAEFYRHVSHDWNEPLKTIAYRAEGTLEFQSLLFIPSKAPMDFYYQGYQTGLALYAKKVMIQESCEELLPHYLRFVKGVIESSDLSLNISREILQHDRIIIQMKKSVTRKVLDTLQDMQKNDHETYLKFWKEFGPAVKEGVTSDYENRDRLIPLLEFASSNDPEKLTTLDDVIGRMAEGNDTIYYITGEDRKLLENSPHLETLKARSIEVLYLTDPVDELVVQAVREYKGKKLQSAAKGELKLDGEEAQKKTEEELKQKTEEFKPLIDAITPFLAENVKEVKLTHRLVSAPACLVSGEFDMSPLLEKLLQKEGAPKSKRVLELNPQHALVQKMNALAGNPDGKEKVEDMAALLFGYACLAEGTLPPDVTAFNQTLAKWLAQ